MEQNQPAFPTSNWQKIAPMANGYNEGMTLRDYFAAKAMQGLLASSRDLSWRELGALSYDAADAMMKAREE